MKHYIFDLGAVIVIPMKQEILYENIDWNINFEEFKYIFSKSTEAIKLHTGELNFNEYFNFLKQYMNTKISFEEFMNIYIKSKQGVYQDTVDIIKYLKNNGNKIYLLSNLRQIDFELFIKEFDISIFNKLFLSYEMKMLKPNDDIYQKVIQEINDLPSSMYFFDDSQKNVEAAIRNGLNAFEVTGKNIKEILSNELNIYINN